MVFLVFRAFGLGISGFGLVSRASRPETPRGISLSLSLSLPVCACLDSVSVPVSVSSHVHATGFRREDITPSPLIISDKKKNDSMLELCGEIGSPPSPASSSFSAWISIGIFRPRKFKHIGNSEALVEHLSDIAISFHKTGLVKSAVLKGVSSDHVAVYSLWQQEGASSNDPDIKEHKLRSRRSLLQSLGMNLLRKRRAKYPPSAPLPQLAAYEKAISEIAHVVELSWYEVSCWDSKHKAISPYLKKGDIVHLRGIFGKLQDEDVLSYSCLAILKSYFDRTEGLLSYTFYKSLDGLRMTGLGVWQSFEMASVFLHAPGGAPEECYWRSLGAKTQFGIYKVAFVTD